MRTLCLIAVAAFALLIVGCAPVAPGSGEASSTRSGTPAAPRQGQRIGQRLGGQDAGHALPNRIAPDPNAPGRKSDAGAEDSGR